jgi:protein TonB
MSEPVGGYEKFLAAIKANLRYPEGLTANGRVYVAFVVDTTGELNDFSIMRGFHPLADEEALRVLRELNYRFKPSRQAGKPVSMRFVMPIVFER